MSVLNLGVHFCLMIEIVRERSVDLSQRKMRILEMNFLRTVSVREMVEHDFNNLDVCVVDPRHARFIYPNVTGSRCDHEARLRHDDWKNNCGDDPTPARPRCGVLLHTRVFREEGEKG